MTNPYKSPANAESQPAGSKEHEREYPGTALVTASAGLAVFVEGPCGMEAGLIYGPLWDRGVFLIIVAKVICLTVVFLPLVIYVGLNGLRALKRVWGRATIAAVIAMIALAHNVLMLSLRYGANP